MTSVSVQIMDSTNSFIKDFQFYPIFHLKTVSMMNLLRAKIIPLFRVLPYQFLQVFYLNVSGFGPSSPYPGPKAIQGTSSKNMYLDA